MNVGALQHRVEPLSRHRLFQSCDIDVARHVVAQKFCAHALIPGKGHQDFEIAHNHAAGRTLSLNYMRYGSEVTINPGELTHFYLLQVPLRGEATVRNGRKTVAAACGTATILNPTLDTVMTWGKGCEKLLLQINRDALHQAAEKLVGRALPHPVVFDPEVNLATPALHAWRQGLMAAIAVAERGAAFGTAAHKHQANFEEQLISGFLNAQPSTISHMLAHDLAPISSAQIRRARTYMVENLSDPITISQVAAEADCSPRALQMGFQREFNCTPNQYLSRLRMDHAHFLLQTSPPQTQVQSIAFDSGFSHLGRFSIAYRKAFGCSPRETLIGNSFV